MLLFRVLHWRRRVCFSGLRLRQKTGKQGIYGLIDFMVGLMGNIFGNVDGLSPDLVGMYPYDRPDNVVIQVLGKKIFIREEILTHVPKHVVKALQEDTIRDAGRKILRNIFPPREVMSDLYSVPLASKRLYLHYAKRPFDLFLKHGRLVSEVSRMKDDVMLNRWIDSRANPSAPEKPK